MDAAWITLTPPAEPVVDLAMAKRHCNVHVDADDALIVSLVDAAAELVEQRTGRAYVNRTLKLFADEFPGIDKPLCLPRPPLSSITSIEYVDGAGVLRTMDEEDFVADSAREPGQVYPSYGGVWPSTRRQPNAVQVTYVAGYGTAAAVPRRVAQAVLLLVGHWYENRESVLVGTISKEIEFSVESLLTSLWKPGQ